MPAFRSDQHQHINDSILFTFYLLPVLHPDDIAFAVKDQHIIIVGAEDNLLKGASAQAVQCANIRYNFPETTGLF